MERFQAFTVLITKINRSIHKIKTVVVYITTIHNIEKERNDEKRVRYRI
jgi:hypothetical protein